MLCLNSSMWGVMVRILLNGSCSELQLRNEMEWAKCDIGL